MKKIRTWFRTPIVTVAALVIAVGLIVPAGISGAQAVLNARSDRYLADISLDEIGVTLLENGDEVASRDYDSAAKDGSWTGTTYGKLSLSKVTEKGADGKEKPLVLNKKYDESLTVQNSRTVGEYVRVSIFRYWTDAKNNKRTDLDPTLIKLYLNGNDLDTSAGSGGWTVDQDPSASTALRSSNPGERLVLYYGSALAPGDETTPFLDQIAVSNEIATMIEQKPDGNTITASYLYNGMKFNIEVTVDAVQDHHAEEAMKSVWGVDAQGGNDNGGSNNGNAGQTNDNQNP